MHKKILYSSPTANINIDLSLSKQIILQQGCRQGCPLSPSFFNLFIEPLAKAIREETTLESRPIGGVEKYIRLYLDDVLITLKNPASGPIANEHPGDIWEIFWLCTQCPKSPS